MVSLLHRATINHEIRVGRKTHTRVTRQCQTAPILVKAKFHYAIHVAHLVCDLVVDLVADL